MSSLHNLQNIRKLIKQLQEEDATDTPPGNKTKHQNVGPQLDTRMGNQKIQKFTRKQDKQGLESGHGKPRHWNHRTTPPPLSKHPFTIQTHELRHNYFCNQTLTLPQFIFAT